MMTNNIHFLLTQVALLFPAFLAVFTFRGFFQTLVAYAMGDDTAKYYGFLSLNPVVHVDIMGITTTLAFFLILGVIFGEMIPTGMLILFLIAFGVRWAHRIPVDENNFTYHKLGGILTALSGSLGSFVLAFLFCLTLKAFSFINLPKYAFVSLIQMFDAIINMAIWFGILDLIPLPPFDGGKVLRYLLPYSKQYILDSLEAYSLYIILIIFFLPGISDVILNNLYVLHMYIKSLMFMVVA